MYMQIQTLNISLPADLVKMADLYAEKEFKTRSELVKTALMAYLKDIYTWEDMFAYGDKIGKKMGIKSEEDVNRIIEEYRHGK